MVYRYGKNHKDTIQIKINEIVRTNLLKYLRTLEPYRPWLNLDSAFYYQDDLGEVT